MKRILVFIACFIAFMAVWFLWSHESSKILSGEEKKEKSRLPPGFSIEIGGQLLEPEDDLSNVTLTTDVFETVSPNRFRKRRSNGWILALQILLTSALFVVCALHIARLIHQRWYGDQELPREHQD